VLFQGEHALRKTLLLYPTSAVVLGLLLVLVPLVTVAEITPENAMSPSAFAQEGLKALDRTQFVDASRIPRNEVAALAISFFLALVAYALFKRKNPRRYERIIGPYVN
jgi:hypothetical protein